MCQYWATTFPCGCFTWRSSGYYFCEKRGKTTTAEGGREGGGGGGGGEGIGCGSVTLRRYTWKTFCPASRKALRGRRWTPGARLATCCGCLGETERAALCHRCDSTPTDASAGPTLWHCSGHLVQDGPEVVIDSDNGDCDGGTTVSLADAEVFFERAIKLWPIDHQKRYFRRKGDKACRDAGWSY
ncbi:hypothetical protein SAMD00023353_4900540 [Rosellinia necatrix]|uniref:Uncharacterized protein n=1 Tax=Rosellinia necatrix TaxID=77044 RepID=A0A1W2TPP9_ROSNE|nr:hypothetical protein SAMD00023353_4900540 [Rosellinia necatrix]